MDVVGISPDPPARQKRFDEKNGLGFPLLSDEKREVARAFGALGKKSFMGKSFVGILRSSFVIDERGNLLGSWYKISPKETVPKALELLG